MVNSGTNHVSPSPLIRRLRLAQLELVRMAGQGANFRAMAEALHLSQPAITKMAQELERQLGATVFERGAAGVRLNPLGLAVLGHAQRALAALEHLQEDLPRYRAGGVPALRIGSPSVTAAVLLAQPMAHWLRAAPGRRVLLTDGVSAQLVAALRSGELDCVVGSMDEGSTTDQDLAQLLFEPLYDDHVTLLTHRDTVGLDGRLRLQQLLHLPWVMPPRASQVWLALRHQIAGAGDALPRGVAEVNSIPTISTVLLQSPGTIGAMRADAGRYLARTFGLRLLDVRPRMRLPPVGILRMRSAPPSPELDILLSLVRQEVRKLFSRYKASPISPPSSLTE
jgi:DNA-binding transcriptional LysR family regulator